MPEWGENIKLIYRHYATLYFVFAVDAQESDLGILDLIQVFVEALDKCFENVCELDLIFHSDRVHYVLDEIVMGGMVLETNISAILQSIKEYVGRNGFALLAVSVVHALSVAKSQRFLLCLCFFFSLSFACSFFVVESSTVSTTDKRQ